MTSCPRCQNPLPDPPGPFCPSCGADLALASPATPPIPPPLPPPLPPGTSNPGGWDPGPGARTGTPWDRRDQIGLASALIETTQGVLTAPAAFFRSMAVTGGIGGPLLYAVIVGYVGVVVSAIYEFVLSMVMGSSFGSSFGGSEQMAAVMPYLQGAMGLGIKLILGPVFVVIGIFIFAGIVHLALMALGGAARGFEATFRVACYSEASALLNIVPVCGSVVASIALVVLMVIGLAEAHGTTRGRAAAAVLLPIVLCCCCIVLPIVAFIMSLAAKVAGTQ
jgi:hypothetical protein